MLWRARFAHSRALHLLLVRRRAQSRRPAIRSSSVRPVQSLQCAPATACPRAHQWLQVAPTAASTAPPHLLVAFPTLHQTKRRYPSPPSLASAFFPSLFSCFAQAHRPSFFHLLPPLFALPSSLRSVVVVLHSVSGAAVTALASAIKPCKERIACLVVAVALPPSARRLPQGTQPALEPDIILIHCTILFAPFFYSSSTCPAGSQPHRFLDTPSTAP